MLDKLEDLRLFMTIAAAGSLSEASRRSGLPLPSVSRRLATFENRLGVRLLDRSARKFELTAEGVLLRKRATEILGIVDATVSELDSTAGPVQGKVRISAPNAIGRRQISRICHDFVTMHPDVSIELVLSDDRPDVTAESLDLAIQTKRPTAEDVVQRRLLSSRRVMCASPAYLERYGVPSHPSDLRKHACILLRRADALCDQWQVLENGMRGTVTVRGALVSNSSDTVHVWALAGAGIAVKALWDIRRDLDSGDLVEVLPEYACDDISLYATYADRRNLHVRLRKFLDYLCEHLPLHVESEWKGKQEAHAV